MKYLITEASKFPLMKLIKQIKKVVDGKTIPMSDLEPESSPVIGDNNGDVHMIEILYKDMVVVHVWDPDGNIIDEYKLPYDKLELDTLKDIWDILEGAKEDRII